MKLLINILSTLIGLLWFGVGCWQHDKVVMYFFGIVMGLLIIFFEIQIYLFKKLQ